MQHSIIGPHDEYVYAITALLPLSAAMLVLQVNPYHALVIRGILGAVAALVYTLLGAADVALTEALVGTMLAVTLYAVAVRSSMVLRLGVLKDEAIAPETGLESMSLEPPPRTKLAEAAVLEDAKPFSPPAPQVAIATPDDPLQPLLDDLRTTFGKYHLRLELVPYADSEALQQALLDKEIHVTCTRLQMTEPPTAADPNAAMSYQALPQTPTDPIPTYQTTTRLHRIYEILQTELPSSPAIAYVGPPTPGAQPGAQPGAKHGAKHP
ncbi:MAG: DUF4040 domain-containing protein [Cyanobacteria bacterium J069]|nr:MAG: DUF4040 domain-containing protein [Cyanobacteria bacterium J069]